MNNVKDIDRDSFLMMTSLTADAAHEARGPSINVLTRSRHAPSLTGFALALTALVVALPVCLPTPPAEEITSALDKQVQVLVVIAPTECRTSREPRHSVKEDT